jgi:hypothetical protein
VFIPSEIGELQPSTTLVFSNNELFGTVPASLGTLSVLSKGSFILQGKKNSFAHRPISFHSEETLLLNGNNFTGDFDSFMCPKGTVTNLA